MDSYWRHIEYLCEKFEREFKTGQDPTLPHYLQQIDEQHRDLLLINLLPIDVNLRQEQGLPHGADYYCRLLPEFREFQRSSLDTDCVSDDADEPIGLPPRSDCLETVTAEGKYRLVHQIGEGGMGAVWLAEQVKPIRRQVAIKLVKSTVPTNEILARFDAERQALALMNHPNITTIYDAGITSSGLPFFAMEMVNGSPVTDYCDHHQLGIKERLKLFALVCRAVQHAHQKGVLHRDLKPTNVLVTTEGSQPKPTIIDFGLAKAVDQGAKLSDKTLTTKFGDIVGTLHYMSPEQTEANGIHVDTRSDIYALGVILYELLTGSTPLDEYGFTGKGLLGVLERLRSGEPPAPSQRLKQSGDAIHEISSQRQISSTKLLQILRGELDWIVLKALEKDPSRRYQTAGEFAADIDRFLKKEPVQAKPPSVGYQLKKFVRKHAIGTAMGLLIVALMATTIFVTTVELFNANKLVVLERTASQRANDEKEKALEAAETAENLLKIFMASFDSANPMNDKHLEMTAEDVLVQFAKSVEDYELRPIAKLLLLNSLTKAFFRLGKFERAISTADQASLLASQHLPDTHPTSIQTQSALGVAYQKLGRYEDSLEVMEECLDRIKAAYEPDHPGLLQTMNNVATLYSLTNRHEKATRLLSTALEISTRKYGADHLNVAQTRMQLASSCFRANQVDKALVHGRIAIEIGKAQLPTDSHILMGWMNDLANFCMSTGYEEEALELYRKSLDMTQRKLGPDHPKTLHVKSNLAIAYHRQKRWLKAISLYREVLEQKTRSFGPKHRVTLDTLNNLAMAYDSAGQLDKALPLYEKAYKSVPAVFGPDHPFTLDLMESLAAACDQMEKHEQAIDLYQSLLGRFRTKYGDRHRKTLRVTAGLGENFLAVGKFAETESAIHGLLTTEELETAKLPRTEALALLSLLGEALVKQEKLNEAREVFTAAYHLQKENHNQLGRIISMVVRQIELSKALRDETGRRKWQSELVLLLFSRTPAFQFPR